jgi:hypothetical protein
MELEDIEPGIASSHGPIPMARLFAESRAICLARLERALPLQNSEPP